MSATHSRRRALAALVSALLLLPVASCSTAPVVTMCEVQASKMGNSVYLFPVVYVRVYDAAPFEATPTIAIISAGGQVVRTVPVQDVLVESGGAYVCFREAMTTTSTGVGPLDLAALGTLTAVRVRVTMALRDGSTQVVEGSPTFARTVDMFPPNFSCNSTRCGR